MVKSSSHATTVKFRGAYHVAFSWLSFMAAELFVNGEIVQRPPERQRRVEPQPQRANDRPRYNDRTRYVRRRENSRSGCSAACYVLLAPNPVVEIFGMMFVGRSHGEVVNDGLFGEL
ncbi:hypothetical protein POTOM_030322 [Populus tomentosa]|uniref:Uncharacterized protein n=1 Tax=Populus tomentosa TaxID=118781 RepID=A0A8X8CTU6_POPTO|nr:hypothetical protein POTOM_030322 [Populus tomentosa]